MLVEERPPPRGQHAQPAGKRLGDRVHVLRHGVACGQLIGTRPARAEPRQERLVRPIQDRLGRVDERAHRRNIEIDGQLRLAHIRRQEAEREVGQPGQGGPRAVDGAEQERRPENPIEGRDLDEGNALQRGQEEAGDQTHVVVERQPGGDPIARRKLEHAPVGLVVTKDGAVTERDALLQAGRARGVLQQRDVVLAAGGPVAGGEDLGQRGHDCLARNTTDTLAPSLTFAGGGRDPDVLQAVRPWQLERSTSPRTRRSSATAGPRSPRE
jgi:hypothetical protein